jgi:NH3-dependent NAD+ synthetase
MEEWNLPLLREFLEATPTAELIPGLAQSDEIEMGMSYNDLSSELSALGLRNCLLSARTKRC